MRSYLCKMCLFLDSSFTWSCFAYFVENLFASFIGQGRRPRSKHNCFPPTRTSTVYCAFFLFGQNWLKSGENSSGRIAFSLSNGPNAFQWGKVQSSESNFSKLQRIRMVWPRALCSRASSVLNHQVTCQPRPRVSATSPIWDLILSLFFFIMLIVLKFGHRE